MSYETAIRLHAQLVQLLIHADLSTWGSSGDDFLNGVSHRCSHCELINCKVDFILFQVPGMLTILSCLLYEVPQLLHCPSLTYGIEFQKNTLLS